MIKKVGPLNNVKQSFVVNRGKAIQNFIGIRMSDVLRRMQLCKIVVIFDKIQNDNIRKCVQLRYEYVEQFGKFLTNINKSNKKTKTKTKTKTKKQA